MNDDELNRRELTGDQALRFAREAGMEEASRQSLFYAGVGDLIRFARLVRAGWTPPGVVTVCQPAADKITIRYERVGRCFWHIGCAAQRHSPPMSIGESDSATRRTVIRCTACGEEGYYPFGAVGDVCCERAAGATEADCA